MKWSKLNGDIIIVQQFIIVLQDTKGAMSDNNKSGLKHYSRASAHARLARYFWVSQEEEKRRLECSLVWSIYLAREKESRRIAR